MRKKWYVSLLFVGTTALAGCEALNAASSDLPSSSPNSQQGTGTGTPTVTVTPTPTPAPTPELPPPRASSDANESVCAASAAIKGTDVSAYDPGTQWTVLQHSGAGFAYVKATEGLTYTNVLFAGDWSASKSAGLYRGAYHFFHPGDDPTSQAEFFLKTMGSLASNDLPPMLDWETTDGVSTESQIQNALIWLQAVEQATGKTPVIYVDPSFWNELGNPTEFERYPLFVAGYDISCPEIPPPWSSWVFWQSNVGPVTGLTSDQADQDNFNGSLTQLSQFATSGILPTH